MKLRLIFILFVLLSTAIQAQTMLESALKQARSSVLKANTAAEKAAEHFRFLEGAYETAEINQHLLLAREDLDSLITYSKKATYQSSDAAYFARDAGAEKLKTRTEEIKKLLQKNTKTQESVMKKIDEFINYGSYNLDSYLSLLLQDFESGQTQLQEASRKLKQAQQQLNNTENAPIRLEQDTPALPNN
ncbi:hypothetical protein [Sunxiuqinia rutila]|uniref:hypothetical protein n=1 Tax=Sunxiuqinia rutila TaxID=1397841 RepID=UPI003D361179